MSKMLEVLRKHCTAEIAATLSPGVYFTHTHCDSATLPPGRPAAVWRGGRKGGKNLILEMICIIGNEIHH